MIHAATMELVGLSGYKGATVKLLLTHAGEPSAVSDLLLRAVRNASCPAALPSALLDLGCDNLRAGIESVHDYSEIADFHYQLWVPTEGCSLMVLVRGVRAEKGRREWFVRNGPMSLESFLLAHQELQPDDLPLWGVKASLLEVA